MSRKEEKKKRRRMKYNDNLHVDRVRQREISKV